jgi:hypothetical protein
LSFYGIDLFFCVGCHRAIIPVRILNSSPHLKLDGCKHFTA